MNSISDLLTEAGYASLTVMKSSSIVLGVEVISRIAEGIYQRFSGHLPRPDKYGFAHFAFKLIRPFSGVQAGHYKLPTGLLVVSAVGMSAITFVGNQLASPPAALACVCPLVSLSTTGSLGQF